MIHFIVNKWNYTKDSAFPVQQLHYKEDLWQISIVDKPDKIEFDEKIIQSEASVLSRLEEYVSCFQDCINKSLKSDIHDFLEKLLNHLQNINHEKTEGLLNNYLDFLKEFDAFSLENPLAIESQYIVPEIVGKNLTKLFLECDFSGLLLVTVKLLIKLIDKILNTKSTFLIAKFSKNRLDLLTEIVQLLKALLIVGKNNVFFFNYGFLKLLSYIFSINDMDNDSIFFQNERTRMELLIASISKMQKRLSKPDWIYEFEKINEVAYQQFPKIYFRENYFYVWKRLLEENEACFCRINYPKKKEFSLQDKQVLHTLIQKMPQITYCFKPASPIDTAITLPNYTVEFRFDLIDGASTSNKKKIYILEVALHEKGHEKGLISYKDKRGAGFYVLHECFGSVISLEQMRNDEKFYEFLLSEFIISTSNLTSFIRNDEFQRKEKEEESKEFNSQGILSKSYDEKKLPVCGYTFTRDLIIQGMGKIFFDKELKKKI